MGTNYYVIPQPPCEHCGRAYEARHIGKSSYGWAFGLHVYPEEGIANLSDWKTCLDGKRIIDEYGRDISVQEMLDIIERRWHPMGLTHRDIDGYHCIGTEETCDYLIGEFL